MKNRIRYWWNYIKWEIANENNCKSREGILSQQISEKVKKNTKYQSNEWNESTLRNLREKSSANAASET